MNKERHPLISIGITCFNAIDTIDRAIASALNQDWSNIEIIIVDDGSFDGTSDHLRKKWLANDQIRVIFNQNNLGVGGTRNIIIKNVKGDFLAFFDDDDESLPDRIRLQYQRITEFEKDTGAFLIGCYASRLQIFSNGITRHESTLGSNLGNEPSGNEIMDLILLGKPIPLNQGSCATCSLMARMEVFEILNGFDSKLLRGEDTDFNLRLGQVSGFLIGVEKVLVNQHMTSAADKSPEQEYQNALLFYEKHKLLFSNNAVFNFSIQWIRAKLLYRNKKIIEALGAGSRLLAKFPALTIRRTYWGVKSKLLNRPIETFD
jgi:glycosyltransferase involved in cell wall biosynthesis